MRKLVILVTAALGAIGVPAAAHASSSPGAVYVSVNHKTVVNMFPNGPVLPIAPGVNATVFGTNVQVSLFAPSPCGQPCP